MNLLLLSGRTVILCLILWNLLIHKTFLGDQAFNFSSRPVCLADGGIAIYSGPDTICVRATTGTFSVHFNRSDPNVIKPRYSAFVINETEVDHTGTDTAEFIEILGPSDSSLNGFVLVFFNGNATSPANASYRVIDLDRFRTDSCGYFLVRGPGLPDPHPDSGLLDTAVSVSGGFIQNGPDAIALYHKSTYANNSSPVLTDLADVIVYHNASGSIDTNLLTALGQSRQYTDQLLTSLARNPDGEGDFIKDSTPSPGSANSVVSLYSYLWLLTRNDSILLVNSGSDLSDYPASFTIADTGHYQVFGLSCVGTRDSFLNKSLRTIPSIVQEIQNGYCASLTLTGISVLVSPQFRFLDVQAEDCTSFDSMGTYQIRIRWLGPTIHPKGGPDYLMPLPGTIFDHGDTIVFLSAPVPGGDTVSFRLIDPYCHDTLIQYYSQFCNYCSLMHPPDSLPTIRVCANDVFTILPKGGGVEQIRPTCDLFFSEYVEGSSNNKCLELYNGTGQDVDLGLENYRIEIFFNGQTIPLSLIPLNGIVQAGTTFVICHNQADPVLTNQAQQTSGNMDFNGDDAIVLKHGNLFIDIIGQVGIDPGSQWGTGLVSTQDNTLIRNKFIYQGDSIGHDAFIPGIEWSGFVIKDFSDLGQHHYKATILVPTGYNFYSSPTLSMNSFLGNGQAFSTSTIPDTQDTIYYSAVNANYGCESQAIPVFIISSSGELVCLGQVRITLSSIECNRTLSSDDVVKNPGYCDFSIHLAYPFGTRAYPAGNILDRSHLGRPILYQASRPDGNSCWGYLTLDDQFPSISKCGNDTLNCFEFHSQRTAKIPAIDPCSGLTGIVQHLEFRDSPCTSAFNGIWIRTRIISDLKSLSRICTDTIWMVKVFLTAIVEPESIRLDCDQLRGYTPDLMIPDSLLQYQRYGIISDAFRLVPTLDGTGIYPSPGIGCHLIPSYLDLVMPLCGSGFIIRREWRILDWCSGRDTLFVQYIRIEDFKPPRPSSIKPVLIGNTEPHNCLGFIRRVRPLRFNDCSELQTSVYYSYPDPGIPGKIIHIEAESVSTMVLPVGKHIINFKAVDACGFTATGQAEAVITDGSPPEAVCNTPVTLSVDPVQCWARIYALDLNNGSFDNCKSNLHFAIAEVDSINYWKDYWFNHLAFKAGKSPFSTELNNYIALIDHWINAYVFRDFLDLHQGNTEVILRVYESDSIPVQDVHVFPFDAHDWFCYNAYPLSRAEINYSINQCSYCGISRPELNTLDSLRALYEAGENFDPVDGLFEANRALTVCSFNPLDFTEGSSVCNNLLYRDATCDLSVVDKFPPRVEPLPDFYMYCDGAAIGLAAEVYGVDPDPNNPVVDFSCRDRDQRPYKEIESVLEHDTNWTDAFDPGGKAFGYYGCNKFDQLILDEDGPHFQYCNEGAWKPIYCHSWLCEDKYDLAGGPEYNKYFWMPRFSPGAKNRGGKGEFLITDNCQLDTSAIEFHDSSLITGCGQGWIQRKWTVADGQGNTSEAYQKIILRHRSDFEVLFPPDTTIEINPMINSALPVSYPMISDEECEIIGISFTDEPVYFSPDLDSAIIRTWTVRDWCLTGESGNLPVQEDIIVDDRKLADPVARPCTYRYLKDGGDGQIRYSQIIHLRKASGIKITREAGEVIRPGEVNKAGYTGMREAADRLMKIERRLILWPNQPNPFTSETRVHFYTSFPEAVFMEVREISGKLIYSLMINSTRGINEVRLNRSQFPLPGLYFFSLRSGDSIQTIKVLAMDE